MSSEKMSVGEMSYTLYNFSVRLYDLGITYVFLWMIRTKIKKIFNTIVEEIDYVDDFHSNICVRVLEQA